MVGSGSFLVQAPMRWPGGDVAGESGGTFVNTFVANCAEKDFYWNLECLFIYFLFFIFFKTTRLHRTGHTGQNKYKQDNTNENK